jgi:hypothetical protein
MRTLTYSSAFVIFSALGFLGSAHTNDFKDYTTKDIKFVL